MRLLLDTHLLVWAAKGEEFLPPAARPYIDDPSLTLLFSAASILEVSIKHALGRPDFEVAPAQLRTGLLAADYVELAVTADHAIGVGGLPPIHRDPFDRLLVAQALAEGVPLLTADAALAAYPGRVIAVRP